MKFIATLFSALIIGFSCRAQVQPPPILHCVSCDNNGDIVLNWSLPSTLCGGAFNAYYIFYSNNINGPYTPITITNQALITYTHNVGNCGSTVYYYYMQSDFNCPGYSFPPSDTLDNLDPVAPEINFVTVNNGLAEINWQSSTSPEAYGYIVYQFINGSYIPIDTVYGKNNTNYLDVNSTPGADTMSYSLATIDSCFNTGPINDFPQHTILLKDSVVRCTQTIYLRWTDYINWKNGVDEYDIFVSKNGAAPAFFDVVPADSLFYQTHAFNDGDSLCFTIVAKENITGFTSVSNEVCIKMNVVQPAYDFYIRNVTVVAPKAIRVSYSVDPRADITKMEIDRGADSTSFSVLAVFSPPADLSVINSYLDTTALTDQVSYYYRVIAQDSCGRRDTSSIGKSIFLRGYAFTDLSFYITWDESFFDYGTVRQYDIYRDDGTGFNFIVTDQPEVFVYEEKNLPVITPCYYVEAIDSMILPNGVKDTIHSRSNVLCLNQPSQIYMPNAFAPEGKNNIFRPVLNVQGVKTFSFSVFNRWGEEIFTSLDPDTGWNGKYKGFYVQQGAYAYMISLVDENGKRVEAKGTVLVVR